RTVSDDLRIVGSAQKFAGIAPVVEDEFASCGPLGGIHAALRKSDSEFNLILAVDLPFVPSEFLRSLAAAAEGNSSLVTIPSAGGKWHPLCAVYRRGFAPVAEKALRENRLRLTSIIAEINPRVLEEVELRNAGFTPALFRNVNTPEDFETAKRELE